jgi:hypothetical protein
MFIKPGPVSVGWRRRLADDEEADGQQRRFKNHNCTFDQIVRRRSPELGRWPLLRSMQKSQHDDLLAANFVDGDERQRREGNLSRPLDATRPSEVREHLQRSDALDHGLCHASSGFRTILCTVVADPFEIICGIRRPADAHQPR